MATPRSPYVCIGDSLLDEPWPREVKATLVMLSCHMHTRWRSDRRLTLEAVASPRAGYAILGMRLREMHCHHVELGPAPGCRRRRGRWLKEMPHHGPSQER